MVLALLLLLPQLLLLLGRHILRIRVQLQVPGLHHDDGQPLRRRQVAEREHELAPAGVALAGVRERYPGGDRLGRLPDLHLRLPDERVGGAVVVEVEPQGVPGLTLLQPEVEAFVVAGSSCGTNHLEGYGWKC